MSKTLVLFRHDLRLSDNPALTAASENGAVTCLYVLEDGIRPLGGASLWWLHHSLTALKAELAKKGVQLVLRKGNALEIIKSLNFDAVYWNRRYTKEGMAIDKALKADLSCETKSFSANFLQEPFDLKEYKVFTPYYKASLQLPSRDPLPIPDLKGSAEIDSDALSDWELLPTKPNWATGFSDWKPGERGAVQTLQTFLENGLNGYKEGRDRPDQTHISRLSPHLAFGEISPHQIKKAVEFSEAQENDKLKFLTEIGWRQFSAHLLYHNPDLAWKNFNAKFDSFPFAKNDAFLKLWQQGKTGYPIIDAGMRELWQTGFMHNRVRMIVASFLIKHCLIDWREGENWFWDCLLDADSGNNAASWQWVAGSGADASPYFRIFNPVLQGEKFDPEGDYVKRFCPELQAVPARFIHTLYELPPMQLRSYGVVLGVDYPKPIIDLKIGRDRALEAFKNL